MLYHSEVTPRGSVSERVFHNMQYWSCTDEALHSWQPFPFTGFNSLVFPRIKHLTGGNTTQSTTLICTCQSHIQISGFFRTTVREFLNEIDCSIQQYFHVHVSSNTLHSDLTVPITGIIFHWHLTSFFAFPSLAAFVLISFSLTSTMLHSFCLLPSRYTAPNHYRCSSISPHTLPCISFPIQPQPRSLQFFVDYSTYSSFAFPSPYNPRPNQYSFLPILPHTSFLPFPTSHS